MNRSRTVIVWSLAAILVVAAGGWVYLQRVDEQEALEQADLLTDSGIALFNQQKYAEALDVLKDVPGGGPREWQTRYYQGSSHIRLKDYQTAASYLEQALALNARETRVLHALGVAYFKLGNLKLSKAHFAAVLEIDPSDQEARGLMDIMAKLEHNSGKTSPEPDQ